MSRWNQFRTVLPVSQTVLAAVLGGWGLWQRNEILGHSWFRWNSISFVAVVNMPAYLAGGLVVWPIADRWPKLPYSVIAVLQLLLFVPILWYWVGSRMDRRWRVTDKAPWIALLIFTLVCVLGGILDIFYVGYIYYGVAVWFVIALVVAKFRSRPGT